MVEGGKGAQRVRVSPYNAHYVLLTEHTMSVICARVGRRLREGVPAWASS